MIDNWPTPQELDDALTSGEYVRTKGRLRRYGQFKDGLPRMCCLGVYQDLCKKRGLQLRGVDGSTLLNRSDLPEDHWLNRPRENALGSKRETEITDLLAAANDYGEPSRGVWGEPGTWLPSKVGSRSFLNVRALLREAIDETVD
jgi:hypothetical protein